MTKARLSHLTNSEPWLMEVDRVRSWLAMIAECDSDNPAAASAAAMPQMVIQGNTAFIPISGVLLKTVDPWLRRLGVEVTGYDEIRMMLAEALGNPKVTSIVLLVDSPGGQVAGGMEAAQAIAEANRSKPVTALVESLAASGAYWLVSQAGHIKAGPNSLIGSIGVYAVYYDYTDMVKSLGVRTIVIKAGEHKGMGVMGAPITDAQIAAVQEVINDMAAHFKRAVAAGRRLSMETVERLATGQLWLAPRAMMMGLVDQVGTKARAAGAVAETSSPAESADPPSQTAAAEAESPTAVAAEPPQANHQSAISNDQSPSAVRRRRDAEYEYHAMGRIIEACRSADAGRSQ